MVSVSATLPPTIVSTLCYHGRHRKQLETAEFCSCKLALPDDSCLKHSVGVYHLWPLEIFRCRVDRATGASFIKLCIGFMSKGGIQKGKRKERGENGIQR